MKHTIRFELIRDQVIPGKNNISPIPQQTIIWGITNRCALKCHHCYDWDNIDEKDHLSIDQLRQILAKIELQGIRHIQLSGGEPLVRFGDLISIIQEGSARIDFWLLTSGFGLTAEKVHLLKESGLKGVQISLDHWEESAHNHFRNNPKSFEWALKAAENCRKAGIMVSLSLCATREFVSEDNLEAYAKLAVNMGAHFIRILEPRQAGRFTFKKVQLDDQQIDLITRFMIRVNNDPAYKKYPFVTFFGYHQRTMGCLGAGNLYLYIDANGDFHACPFCRGSVGNALDYSFNEAIGRLRKKGCHVFKTTKLPVES